MPIHPSFVTSLEDIANLALGKIGEQSVISDIDTDTGSSAVTVRRFIYQVIREVESEFRWGELTKSVLLAIPMAENDDTYQYTMPSDFLRPASNRDQEYVIENGYLFTGTATDFPFKYIRYSEDPAEWSGLLVKCVYFRLALEICMPITENAQKYAALLEEYEKVVFPRARQVASFDNENPRTRIARGSYSKLRSGIGGAVAAAFNRVIGLAAPGHNHDTDYMPLVATDKISTAFLQDASVTADKLSVDAKALATDADEIVLQDAKDYADAQDVVAVASAVASAEDTAEAKDVIRAASSAAAYEPIHTGVSLASPGYIKHGSGLIEQWGYLTIAAQTTDTVTLPVAWPNGLLGISTSFKVAGTTNISNTTGAIANATNPLTQIDIRNGDGTQRAVWWMVVGH